jgi:phenylacetate-CoA ligase
VPYYRDLWSRRRRAGDRRAWDELANWPVLDKETVRSTPRAFVSDDASKLLFEDHTSGTTGTPLRVWLPRRSVQEWYAIYESRARLWYGVSRRDRWAILGGQLVVPSGATTPPYWVWNAGMRQLYLSTYHLGPRTVADYADALRQHRVTYVLGYPSALADLARLAEEHDVELPRLRVAIGNAEPVLERQRRQVAAAMGTALRETYGMSEAIGGASECEHGRMHLWPDAGILELLDEQHGDQPVPAGEAGSAVMTGLLNPDMPLVRYRMGDRLTLARPAATCECGRTLPLVDSVDGRADDAIVTDDGRRIGRLDPVFKADLPLHEAQIVQDEDGALTVFVVPAEGYDASSADTVCRRVRDRVGEMDVRVVEIDRIPRGPNGKFKAVVSKLERAQ